MVFNKKKIRVAVVCGSMNIGGGETMAAKLAGYIDKKVFDVKYFVISKYIDNQIADNLKKNEVTFECLELPNSFSINSYIKFSKALKQFSPDVVHCHLDVSYSWIWAILNNKPLITTMHSDPYVNRDKRVAAVMKVKSILGKLRVIGCSKTTMDLVKKCYHLKADQVNYIHNPIDTSEFICGKKKNIDNIKLVALGRLHNVKNYPLMLNAFKMVIDSGKKAKLYIAGTGPCEEEIRQLITELSINDDVQLLGNVENIPELISNMDVLLLSSVSEACPMVILEAMASGLPVVATNVGGVSELVTDNGFVVESGDTEAFCNAIIKLVEMPELAKKMSEKALEYSKKYDKDIIASQYENEYIKLLKRKVK